MLLIVTNFVPDFWLSGWDNLHPEFNFLMNINRVFFSAWEEFQGLGLPSGMAHATDLPRLLILWILSFVFPSSSLRFIWQFLMLLIGSIGFYFFSKEFIFYKSNKSNIDLYSFVGASFYLLNLGMLQNFYAPQSMFTAQYGFAPLLFLLSFGYLFNSRKKNLFWYGIVSFLASTQAYTPTLILAYFLFLAISVFYFLLISKFSKESILKSLNLFLITVAVHLYWIIPFVYFLFNTASTVSNASINIFSSGESFLLNQIYGSFENIALLKSFWFGNTDFVLNKGSFNFMYAPWIAHLSSSAVTYVGYLLFAIVLLGLLHSIFSKERKNHSILYVIFFIVAVFFLRNNNPPFGFLFNFLQEYLPLFKEALRFPFTKFSVLTTFTYSILFTLGFASIVEKFHITKRNLLLLSLLVLSCLLYWMSPLFKGHLFSKNLIVDYPESYFELFEWFETQDSHSRILNLPMSNYWAWPYYDWGYRGSGFLWYGIEQPILDRAFDVWHPKNEEAFWQISQKIYSGNIDGIESVLNKYDIRWVFLDFSVIVPGNPNQKEILNVENTLSLLKESEAFEQVFSSGKLFVYEYQHYDSFVEIYEESIPSFGASSSIENILKKDLYYFDYGDYLVSKNSSYSIFGDVFNRDSLEVLVQGNGISTAVVLRESLPAFEDLSISIEDVFGKNNPIPVRIEVISPTKIKLLVLPIEVAVDNEVIFDSSREILVDVPLLKEGMVVSLGGDPSYEIKSIPSILGEDYFDLSDDLTLEVFESSSIKIDIVDLLSSSTVSSCGLKGEGSYSLEKSSGSLLLKVNNNTACIFQDLPTFVFENADLLKITFDYLAEDAYPKYCILDVTQEECLNFLTKHIGANSTGKVSDFVKLTKGIYSDLALYLYAESAFFRNSSVEYKDAYLNGYKTFYSTVLDLESYGKESFIYDVYLDSSKNITVTIPVLNDSLLSYSENFDSKVFYYNDVCLFDKESLPRVMDSTLFLAGVKDPSCLYLEFPTLPHKFPYLLNFSHKYEAGAFPEMCVLNKDNTRCLLPFKLEAPSGEWYATSLVIPALEEHSMGYDLLINNVPIAGNFTANYYDSINIYPLPLDWVSSISLLPKGYSDKFTRADSHPLEFSSNLFWYEIKDVPSGYLKLSQVFDRGWVALCFNATCNKEHQLFSSWSNVWKVPNSSSIVLIYIPQILQIFGYIFGLSSLLFVFFRETAQEKHTP